MKDLSADFPKNLIAAVFEHKACMQVRDLTPEEEDEVFQVLRSITLIEEMCTRMRFEYGMTADEIVSCFPKTGDEVKRKIAIAMRKLLHPARSPKLRGFLIPVDGADTESEEQTSDLIYQNSKRLLEAVFPEKVRNKDLPQ